jgi:hypothetical protein
MVEKINEVWTDGAGVKWNVHKRSIDCDVNGCAIHNPSYHPLSDAIQIMRSDRLPLIERICDHGIGHPDPDSASFIVRITEDASWWIHGCDGCCNETHEETFNV